MFRFIINIIDPTEIGTLKSDLKELLTLLGLQDLKDRFIFEDKNERVLIELAPSIFKGIKAIINELISQGLLQSNTFAMQFIFAEPAKENSALMMAQVSELKAVAKTFYASAALSTTCLTCDPSELNYTSILSLILSKGIKAVVVAEGSHDYYAPKKFILDNFDWLRQKQAIVVFENFASETCQSEMDRCVATNTYSNLLRHMTPSIGKNSMNVHSQEFHGKEFLMMQVLCESGIPLVAGDTEASNTLGENDERLSLGNFVMVNNTKEFLRSNTALSNPFIVYFTGAAHARTKNGIPGVSELTGAITVELHDEYRASKPSTIEFTKKGNIKISRNLNDLRQNDTLSNGLVAAAMTQTFAQQITTSAHSLANNASTELVK